MAEEDVLVRSGYHAGAEGWRGAEAVLKGRAYGYRKGRTFLLRIPNLVHTY